MSNISRSGAKWSRILFPSLAVFVFLYLLVYVKPVLFLHVQETPFLKGGEFFTRFLHFPGGIAEYLSRFISQGFVSNFWGALILIVLFSLIHLLTSILLRLTQKKNIIFWPLLIILFTLALMQDYLFPVIILLQLILILLSMLTLVKFTGDQPIRWFIFPLVYCLIYYLAGPGAALVFAAGSLAFFLLSGKILKAVMVLIAALLLPWVAYRWLFNVPIVDAYLWFVPDLSVTVEYRTTPLFMIYMFLIPLIVLAAPVVAWIRKSISGNITSVFRKTILVVLLITGLGIGTRVLFKATSRPLERIAHLCDYHNYNGSFQKTIDLALDSKDQYNISVNVSYVRAIAREGVLTERLFEYPQLIGSMAMQPDKLGSPEYMHAASDFYLDLGYVSESQHFAYADLAINPDNLRSKKRLVVTNILQGKFGAAETFLNSIARHPGQKEFVNRYMMFVKDTSLVNLDPWFANVRSLMPSNFVIPARMTDRLKDLITSNEQNILAFESLQICHLLDHDLGLFMRYLPESLAFYNQIPDLYQQALIIYYYNTEKPGLEEYLISNSNKQQFNTFVNTVAGTGNNKEQARGMLDSLSDTYMYYITYLSPRVTNVKLVQQ